MLKEKYYKFNVELTNIKINYLESLGCGCLFKEIDYAKERTKSRLKYIDCISTSSSLNSYVDDIEAQGPKLGVDFRVFLDSRKGKKYTTIINSFSDGSCTPRKEKEKYSSSGYLIYTLSNRLEKGYDYLEYSSLQKGGTNSVGELTALTELVETTLEYVNNNLDFIEPEGTLISFSSDSEYVIKGFTTYLRTQIERDWKNTKGEPVKYKDLWQRLIDGYTRLDRMGFDIVFKWVKAHKLLKDDRDKCNNVDTLLSHIEGLDEEEFKYFLNERCDILAKSEILNQ